ncbi:MFS transporter [Cellulomonas sp. URHD0024]|uniref:MFS transporter n=1 Tax=Cellulomonas sp. URHD0024 TaxID=1302620 RepID=UPI0004021831|nr:MFS transporter [Cellulomonas sp. URHD0024]
MSEPALTTADAVESPLDDAALAAAAHDRRRWVILGVIAIAQLMIVLDSAIMNIALPSAAEDLGIPAQDISWAITAYTLAFGGLLLLGGRIADYIGRKRAFLIGLVGFAVASGLGGAAQSESLLFAARALQGAFGALLAPASLALITVTFTEGRDRAKAFGVFGAISGGGAAIGLILGGILTEYLGWRWCLYVNLPIALITLFLGIKYVQESKAPGDRHLDIPGAILSSVGLATLVYGFTEASKPKADGSGTVGWTDPTVVTLLTIAVVALVAFVIVETRVKNPLLPMRIVLDRNRGGSYIVFLMIGAGLFSMFLFMTLYFQNILGYTPLRAGFAFLPFSIGIIVGAGVVSQLLPRVGPRPLMLIGISMAIAGMLLLLRTTPDSSYVTTVLPAITIMSLGMAAVFIPASSTALVGVGKHDAGVASALLNTSQQVGGSLGLALLSTFAISATASKLTELAGGAEATQAMVETARVAGYHVAYLGGAVLMFVGLAAAATLISAKKDDLPADSAVAV